MDSPWHLESVELTARLALAAALGGLIGFEREINRHAAGLRTNILVCLGSTLIMLLSIYGFNRFVDETNVRIDPARLAAQVISGIGFLGAGTIMKTGMTIKGLTTAATLWVMAAIGLAVGAGFYYPAILACAMVFLSLKLLNRMESRFLTSFKASVISVQLMEACSSAELFACLEDQKLAVKHVNVESSEPHSGTSVRHMAFRIDAPKNYQWPALLDRLNSVKGVIAVKIEE